MVTSTWTDTDVYLLIFWMYSMQLQKVNPQMYFYCVLCVDFRPEMSVHVAFWKIGSK